MAVPATLPGSTGTTAGSQSASSGQRDGSGGQVSASGTASAGGNYSLDTLPGGLGDTGTGPMTAAERAAVLAGTLNSGYEEFDGFILAERARAQAEANAARNTEIPGDSGGTSSGAGAGGGDIIVAARQAGGMPGPQGAAGAGGGSTNAEEQTFPPPEDIPSGRDDDIVARQLREAAMREPDPELREKLWDEYRRYTGIGG
ncbi:MAG: hypothetical protein A3H44_13545 [Gammaproteobacteria bacterium RIFCSPLOWO2_02_FULL_57_10]|nr:MAG: hypothetical protein A3H44_13545 [Gammaproteobacteria bacterium RIFCSPLOWO2_02_FULL_57_10]